MKIVFSHLSLALLLTAAPWSARALDLPWEREARKDAPSLRPADLDTCINNLRMIDAGKDLWALETNPPSGTTVNRALIEPYFREFPRCPADGHYTIGAVDEAPSCSLHGALTQRTLTPEEVIGSLRERAGEGDADAQFQLGMEYERGELAAKDMALARQWYRRAADQGHVWGQMSLAMTHEGDDGNPVEALRWYRRAAEQGLENAQVMVGTAYLNGHGVPQDAVEALRWFRRAAEQGNAEAHMRIGHAFEYGTGVERNPSAAADWYRRAMALDDDAMRDLARRGMQRVAGNGSPPQVVELAKRFFDHLRAERIAEAYALLADSSRAETSREDLEELARSSGIVGHRGVAWDTPFVDDDFGSIEGVVTTRDGTSLRLKVVAFRRGRVWEIHNVHQPADEAEKRDGREAAALVHASVRSFIESVQADDLTAFHQQFSAQAREEISVDTLRQAFDVFFELHAAGADFSPLLGGAPELDGTPTLDGDGVLALRGAYPLSAPVKFDLSYVREAGEWTLIGFNLSLSNLAEWLP